MSQQIQQTDTVAANTKQARLVVFESRDGRTNWKIVMPKDVPDWLKDPDIMGRLVRGETACKPYAGIAGTAWYRAEEVPSDGDIQKLVAAHEKRERRAAKARAAGKAA